jgi:hypothetical protein
MTFRSPIHILAFLMYAGKGCSIGAAFGTWIRLCKAFSCFTNLIPLGSDCWLFASSCSVPHYYILFWREAL